MRCEIDGLGINYERMGRGAPVLILHGWGANIAAVLPIARCVERLGFEAVMLDFPGFGGSDAPKEPWGMPEYASLTRKFISEQGIEGADVICHSFGGRVTIMLAAAEPGLFNRLVLVDAAGIRPRRGLKYYVRVGAYKLGRKLARIGVIDRMFRLSERQKAAGSADYRALSGVMRDTFVKVVNLDLTKMLDKIENETLLIWGSEDNETPLYMAKLMEKRIKKAGLAVIKGAGHFSYADDYAGFCAIIGAMLGA